jgi:hypothetical protein
MDIGHEKISYDKESKSPMLTWKSNKRYTWEGMTHRTLNFIVSSTI